MRERTYFFITLTLIVLMIASCVALYFFCRDMYRRGQIISQIEREFNAVVGRYFEFDSIIVGTSMSQNFKCSEFDEVTGGYSAKMTTAGGNISEIVFTADYAFRYKKINAVIMDVLISSYTGRLSAMEMPYEMYEENPSLLFQMKNALNIAHLKTCAGAIIKGHKFDRDSIYTWSHRHPSGKKHFVRNTIEQSNALNKLMENLRNTPVSVLEADIKNHLIPWIKRHENTVFYIYLPPHSILCLTEHQEKFVKFRSLLMDALLPLPNVKLYDFQSVEDIVMDYDKHKDVTHYSEKVSSWMIQQLKSDKYLVTPDKRHIFEAAFADLINKFDRAKAMAELRDYYEKHCK